MRTETMTVGFNPTAFFSSLLNVGVKKQICRIRSGENVYKLTQKLLIATKQLPRL